MNELGGGLGAIRGGENHFDFTASLADETVLATVLVTISMSTNNNRVGPSGNQTRDIFDNNSLTEDSSVEDVTDGAVGGLPHLLEGELLDTALIRGDGGALNTNLVLEHSVGAVNSDLIVGGVTVLDGQIIVVGVNIDVGVNMLNTC